MFLLRGQWWWCETLGGQGHIAYENGALSHSRVTSVEGLRLEVGGATGGGGEAVAARHPDALGGGGREEVDEKLDNIMVNIHKNAAETAEKYGRPGDYVFGANVAGFLKIAEAMEAHGIV